MTLAISSSTRVTGTVRNFTGHFTWPAGSFFRHQFFMNENNLTFLMATWATNTGNTAPTWINGIGGRYGLTGLTPEFINDNPQIAVAGGPGGVLNYSQVPAGTPRLFNSDRPFGTIAARFDLVKGTVTPIFIDFDTDHPFSDGSAATPGAFNQAMQLILDYEGPGNPIPLSNGAQTGVVQSGKSIGLDTDYLRTFVNNNGSSTTATIDSEAPSNPSNGDLWYDSGTNYRLYIWSDSDEGGADAWVEASPAGSGASVDTDSIIAGTGITVTDTDGGVVISATGGGGGGDSVDTDSIIGRDIIQVRDTDTGIILTTHYVNVNRVTGGFANAVGNNSVAIGTGARAGGDNSVRIGDHPLGNQGSEAPRSIAIGRRAVINEDADDAIAIGTSAAVGIYLSDPSLTEPQDGIAIGNQSSANGGIAIGYRTKSSGGGPESGHDYNSIAIGHGSSANGYRSIVIGAGGPGLDSAIADTEDCIAIGYQARSRLAGLVSFQRNGNTDDNQTSLALPRQSTDPTSVAGAIFYRRDLNRLRLLQDDEWVDVLTGEFKDHVTPGFAIDSELLDSNTIALDTDSLGYGLESVNTPAVAAIPATVTWTRTSTLTGTLTFSTEAQAIAFEGILPATGSAATQAVAAFDTAGATFSGATLTEHPVDTSYNLQASRFSRSGNVLTLTNPGGPPGGQLPDNITFSGSLFGFITGGSINTDTGVITGGTTSSTNIALDSTPGIEAQQFIRVDTDVIANMDWVRDNFIPENLSTGVHFFTGDTDAEVMVDSTIYPTPNFIRVDSDAADRTVGWTVIAQNTVADSEKIAIVGINHAVDSDRDGGGIAGYFAYVQNEDLMDSTKYLNTAAFGTQDDAALFGGNVAIGDLSTSYSLTLNGVAVGGGGGSTPTYGAVADATDTDFVIPAGGEVHLNGWVPNAGTTLRLLADSNGVSYSGHGSTAAAGLVALSGANLPSTGMGEEVCDGNCTLNLWLSNTSSASVTVSLLRTAGAADFAISWRIV